MVRQIRPEEEAWLLTLAQNVLALGPRVEVDWRLKQQNPAMPYQFYAAGQAAVVEITGSHGVVLGKPEYSGELENFLEFSGVNRNSTDGWLPEGWDKKEMQCMVRQPVQQKPANQMPEGFDEFPTMREVLEVLESNEGRIVPQSARDGFYADVCARRNHGFATIVGLRQAGALVSTAGVYCTTSTQAYLACVETKRALQGKGYAKALVGWLCARFGHVPVTLLCEKDLTGFYNPLGFENSGQAVLFASLTEEAGR